MMISMIYLSSQGICKGFYKAAHPEFHQHCYHNQGALFVYIYAYVLAENVVLQQFLPQHCIYKTDRVPKKLF